MTLKGGFRRASLLRWRGVATALLLTGLLAFAGGRSVNAAAGINHQISFQGKVVNSNGTNVADGSYTFVFAIYSVSSAGSAIWSETKSISVVDGIFQTNLGSSTTLPGSLDFNTDNLYLGVNFNSDGEMLPRVRFTAVPYAFNSDAVDGLSGSDMLRSNASDTFEGSNGQTLTVQSDLTSGNRTANLLDITQANNATYNMSSGALLGITNNDTGSAANLLSLSNNGTGAALTFASGTTVANGILWGTDTNLYRGGSDTLVTDDLLASQGGFEVDTTTTGVGLSIKSALGGTRLGGLTRTLIEGGANAVVELSGVSGRSLQLGNSASDINIYSTAKIQWNDGVGGADTNLYRSAADMLKTDDSVIVSGTLQVGNDNLLTDIGTTSLALGSDSVTSQFLTISRNNLGTDADLSLGIGTANSPTFQMLAGGILTGEKAGTATVANPLLFSAVPAASTWNWEKVVKTASSSFTSADATTYMQLVSGQLRLPTSGSSGGLLLGTDAILYRSTTDTLKTDDNLIVGGASLDLLAQGDVRFYDSDSSNYVAFQSAATVGTNVIWTLPSSDSAGCLSSNGSATLSWATCGGAGGGAPTSAQYLTLALDGTLTAERVLVGTANQVILTDGGANGNLTLSLPQDIHTAATPQFAKLGLGQAANTFMLSLPSSTSATGGLDFGTDVNLFRSGASSLATEYNNDTNSSNRLTFRRTRGSAASPTAVLANDWSGMLDFQAYNGTTYDRLANIYAAVDGTPGASSDMPGRLMFSTTPDGSSTGLEALRIDSSQKLWIGSGAGLDTNLYRGAADTLQTDSSLLVGNSSDLTNNQSITVYGADSSASRSGLVGFYSGSRFMVGPNDAFSSLNLMSGNVARLAFDTTGQGSMTTVNGAAASLTALTMSGTLGIMDGSDTFRAIYLNYTNANHTGASNIVRAIDISNITGDAEATENAVNIGTGWDSGLATGSPITDTVVNAASGGATAMTLSGTLGIFNGSDTFTGISLAYTNANHTGSSNIFNGILIGNITGDAEATENGINIGTGWDSGITTASPITDTVVNAASGGATAMTLSGTLGIFNGSDTFTGLSIAYTNANHTGSGNTFNGVSIANITGDAEANENGINIGTGWDAGVTTGSTIAVTKINAAGTGANAMLLNGTLGIFDGSDTFNGISLAYTNANHTGASNAFNALNVANITGDAEATEIALNVGTGWDYGVSLAIGGTAALNLSDTSFAAAGGILMGADTNWYRGAANELRTDDMITFGSTKTTTATDFKTYKSDGGMGFIFDTSSTYSTGSLMSVRNNGSAKFMVGATGNVIISGTLTQNGIPADVAENIKVSDPTIGAGDIVSAEAASSETVRKALATDQRVMGVISTEPGILISGATDGKPLVLSGRVPVKVVGGAGVKVGDTIVVSDQAGWGTKGTDKVAPMVGIALADQQPGEPTVVVQVQSGLYLPMMGNSLANTALSPQYQSVLNSFQLLDNGLLHVNDLSVDHLTVAALTVNGQIVADSLALSDRSAGRAVIPAGQTSVYVPTDLVGTTDQIMLSAIEPDTTNPQPVSLYRGQINSAQGFWVKLLPNQPLSYDQPFDWLIVK